MMCFINYNCIFIVWVKRMFDPVYWAKGVTCRCCLSIQLWMCSNLCLSEGSCFQVGHSSLDEGSGFSGCYASHIILDKGIAIFKIEDNVPDRLVAPINCALATMVNAISSIPPEKAWYQTALIQVIVHRSALQVTDSKWE